MTTTHKPFSEAILDAYARVVGSVYPDEHAWPVVSGRNIREGIYGKSWVIFYEHTGLSGAQLFGELKLTEGQVGAKEINATNRASVIARLEKLLGSRPQDMLIVVEDAAQPDGTAFAPHHVLEPQLKSALMRHAAVQGLLPMKIFLSHKGADKPRVREYKKTLEVLGFDPWLDEDAMTAGTNLERGLLEGFKASCAAVFFVTPNYVDENFLASEVDYAIQQRRDKGERFQIITLVFKEGGRKGAVPGLLRPYVWKEPDNDLEGLREILRALPLAVGPVRMR